MSGQFRRSFRRWHRESVKKGRSCRRTFCLIFQFFFRAFFLYFHIFRFFFEILECEVTQIFCPLLNFQTLEFFPVFPSFLVFLGKKEENLQKSCSIRTGRSYPRTFCLNFQGFFRAIFCISIFSIFFPNIGMRSHPNILPSIKFPNFGNVSCYSIFSCLSWKRKRKFRKKSCSIRTALETP